MQAEFFYGMILPFLYFSIRQINLKKKNINFSNNNKYNFFSLLFYFLFYAYHW